VAEAMRRLARGGEEIWLGEARVVPWLHRLAPRWTLALVNRGIDVARSARP
jgi:hypothetical protein